MDSSKKVHKLQMSMTAFPRQKSEIYLELLKQWLEDYLKE